MIIDIFVRLADGAVATAVGEGALWVKADTERSYPISTSVRPDKFLERCLWLAPFLTRAQLQGVIEGPKNRHDLPTLRDVLHVLTDKPRSVQQFATLSLEWLFVCGLAQEKDGDLQITPAGRLFLNLQPTHYCVRSAACRGTGVALLTTQQEQTTCLDCQRTFTHKA